MRAGPKFGIMRRVEEHRRLVEEEKRKGEDARDENQRLERNLHEAGEQERLPALVDRLGREVPLDLALIAAEVGERQECPADESRPDRVFLLEIEPEIDGVKLPDRPGDVKRAGDAHAV